MGRRRQTAVKVDNALLDQNTVVSLIVIVGWIFSLCFHEYGHGLAAYIGGDKSIKERGYLSFNPFAYTNVGLSIVLPAVIVLFGGIGLPGAAVTVNNANLRGRVWESIVSLAGPVFTLLFTVVLISFIRAAPPMPVQWLAGASFLALLEIVVLIFNLLPVPGLDGYGIFEPFLPEDMRNRFKSAQRYLFLILIVVLWTVPVVNNMLWTAAFGIAFSFGLDPGLIMIGQSSFRSGAPPLSIMCIILVIVVQMFRKKKAAENVETVDQGDIRSKV